MLSLCASLTMKAEIIHNERTTNECFQINAEICLSLWLVCAMVQYSATHRHVGSIRQNSHSEIFKKKCQKWKKELSAPQQWWASDKCWDRQSRKSHHVYQIATNHTVIRLSPYLIECTRNMLLMICRELVMMWYCANPNFPRKRIINANIGHENATDQINIEEEPYSRTVTMIWLTHVQFK